MESHAFFGDDKQVDPRVEFWGSPRVWPKEGQHHMFFARAAHILGKKLFNELWTGDEPSVVLKYPIHPHLDAATPTADIQYATHILHYCHPGYHARALPLIQQNRPAPMPTPDEWLVAVAISRQISDDTWAAFNRFDQVLRLMATLFERGLVTAALRGHEFGFPVATEPALWLNECSHAWFATCQIDHSNPFSRIPIRTGGKWLYVDRDSFYLWLDLAFSPVPAAACGETATSEAPAGSQQSPEPSEVDGGAAGGGGGKPPKVGRKRGPRSFYKWAEIDAEALIRARSKRPPKSIHALADDMLVWCMDQWGREPGNSTLRRRFKQLLADNEIILESQKLA